MLMESSRDLARRWTSPTGSVYQVNCCRKPPRGENPVNLADVAKSRSNENPLAVPGPVEKDRSADVLILFQTANQFRRDIRNALQDQLAAISGPFLNARAGPRQCRQE